jgi:hypothetical protein
MREAIVSLTAVGKTTWIPSKHSRKSVLFPILNLNPGGTLHNRGAGRGFARDLHDRTGQALTA